MVSPAQYARMRQRMAEKADAVAPRQGPDPVVSLADPNGDAKRNLQEWLDSSPQYEVLTPEGNDD